MIKSGSLIIFIILNLVISTSSWSNSSSDIHSCQKIFNASVDESRAPEDIINSLVASSGRLSLIEAIDILIKIVPDGDSKSYLLDLHSDSKIIDDSQWKSRVVNSPEQVALALMDASKTLASLEVKNILKRYNILKNANSYTNHYKNIFEELIRQTGSIHNFFSVLDDPVSLPKSSNLGFYGRLIIRTISHLIWFNQTRLITQYQLSESDYQSFLKNPNSIRLSPLQRVELWTQIKVAQAKYIQHAAELAFLILLAPATTPFLNQLNLESLTLHVEPIYVKTAEKIQNHQHQQIKNDLTQSLQKAEGSKLSPDEEEILQIINKSLSKPN
jgi:hypothetical protein